MKKFIGLLFVFQMLFFSYSYSGSVRSGVYDLKGYNSTTSSYPNYRGEVLIEKYGENYRLTWVIGNQQVQTGVGIVSNNVLSVAFYDLSNGSTGVVAYRLLGSKEIAGKWAGYSSTGCGFEELYWRSY